MSPSDPTTSPVEVRFRGMAHGGEAVGDLPDGRVVFVGGVLPGETAEIRLTGGKKRWARGEVVRVVEASPDRVEPPCPHFGPCGGCQWQHIRLDRQRELKREILVGQLSHLGGIEDPPVEDVRAVGEADGFGYRNHATFRVTKEGRTAYHRGGSKEKIEIDRCLLLHPLLREWHEALPPLEGAFALELRVGTRTAQRLAMTRGQLSEEAFAVAAERGIPLKRAGSDEITEMVGTERYRVSSKAFFQVNTDGAEVLVDLVLEMLDPQPSDTVVDLYAGVGLFSVPLARKSEKVLAVEGNTAAIRDLRFHKKGLPIHVVGTSVEDSAPQLPRTVDKVVADPPREGLGETIAGRIADMAPSTIVLVACDPASLARDVKALVARGYALDRVVPVDLFPHTFHVEAVARLHRAD